MLRHTDTGEITQVVGASCITLRGEPHDGAFVINGETPAVKDEPEHQETPRTADQVRAAIRERAQQKNSSLDHY
ncbi:hypothetical protein [Rhodococcus wratislaviensis]|uniref:hypothetical protein n=1 Tax=Rhodococcus wratislaviensis TaxID=44752 RepID=UPI0036471A06